MRKSTEQKLGWQIRQSQFQISLLDLLTHQTFVPQVLATVSQAKAKGKVWPHFPLRADRERTEPLETLDICEVFGRKGRARLGWSVPALAATFQGA